jgi:hypothetical protein
MRTVLIVLSLVSALVVVPAARADRQSVAPGTGLQSATELDSGANGICETPARRDDVQAIPVGKGSPFEDEIRCGPDRTVSTAAAGDDVQLVAVGSACGRNQAVIDTGADGIASSTAVPGDEALIAPGLGAPNRPCILAGGNGLADTPDPARGDDARILLVGHAEPNSPVIRCGSNEVAETAANNLRGGDDVQLVPVGAPCDSASTVVVDSGVNGIAETRAQGVDLVLEIPNPKPIRLAIRRRQAAASKRVKVVVSNREFGASAPASRAYALSVSNGSCPQGTVSGVDSDARAGGFQTTAGVRLRGRVKAAFVVTLHLEDITSLDRRIPFRCAVVVEANAIDTAPDPDDAANPSNNSARVEIEAVDMNDL